MEFLKRVFYRSKEVRQNLNPNTHYAEGYVPEAMQILAENRFVIDETIKDYCDLVMEGDHTCFVPSNAILQSFWRDSLGKNLLPSFLKDNRIFDREKIDRVYKRAGDFFEDVNSFLMGFDYTKDFRKLSILPIRQKHITKGWAAVLREYGVFYPSQEAYASITKSIFNSFGGNLTSSYIYSRVNEVLDNDIFRGKGEDSEIYCPAAKQVRDHFGLCIALNVGLIKADKYSSSNRIGLLAGDGSNHFKKPKDMISEYEVKINL